MIVASSLGYFFFAGLQTFAVIFVRGRFHLSQSTATLLLFVVGGGAVFGLVIAGFIADRLLEHGRLDARIVVGGVGYLLGAALLIPGLLVASVALALPIVMLAAAAVTAPNATLDAARLDVVPSPLWGRAESVRTLLRTALEGSAPVLFGFVASQFGAGHPSFANNADVVRRAPATVAQAHGLQLTFVVMLAPLAAAGVMLLAGRRAYPRDVASAQQSERLAGRRSSRG
jgi:sugar phosphate permease